MKVKILNASIHKLIKEEVTRRLFEDKDQLKKLLIDAGFNPDGSAGAAGGGPKSWELYTPESMGEASTWIQAAKDLNKALNTASSEMSQWIEENPLEEDSYGKPTQAYSGSISKKMTEIFRNKIQPVMTQYSTIGADDTEPRNVALEMLERRVKGMLNLDPDDYSIDLWGW
jgi:hypothetical protein